MVRSFLSNSLSIFFGMLLASSHSTTAWAVVTIDTVPIANPGNANDSTGFSGVANSYRIGKFEVTNAQYVDFLNTVDPAGDNGLGLYNSGMSTSSGGINVNTAAGSGLKYSIRSGRAEHPVVFVSWYDAIRFANWMNNGQGSGATESGAYTINGGMPTPVDGLSITRNAAATWWLPSENEWYKAAYHKNNGATNSYWDFATGTDATPSNDLLAVDPGNNANFFDGVGYTAAATGFLTNVGEFENSDSSYHTFDQSGNAAEWNEVVISTAKRGVRGGSWLNSVSALAAISRGSDDPTTENDFYGFRLATIATTVDAAGMFGDYNRNGIVDVADYAVWRRLNGQSGGGLAADGDGDNTVDVDDYNIWRAHIGQAVPGSGAGGGEPVPEPATIMLLALGALSACSCRARFR